MDDPNKQARIMTITRSPDVDEREIGHWYSPKAVAELIAEEREACAKVCRDLAESHKQGTGGECDDDCDFVVAWETAERLIRERNFTAE